MSRLARLTLLAYPRAFRRDFGPDYLRTVADLHTHSGHGRLRIVMRLVGESLTTALAMRWEHLMKPARTTLTIAAAVASLAGLVMGSEAIALFVVALAALAALVFAGRDRPITPADPSLTGRWYWWLAGAAATFLVGLGVVAIAEDDGGLSEAAWVTWMLSWATAAVLGVIGIGLGATRLITHRH